MIKSITGCSLSHTLPNHSLTLPLPLTHAKILLLAHQLHVPFICTCPLSCTRDYSRSQYHARAPSVTCSHFQPLSCSPMCALSLPTFSLCPFSLADHCPRLPPVVQSHFKKKYRNRAKNFIQHSRRRNKHSILFTQIAILLHLLVNHVA